MKGTTKKKGFIALHREIRDHWIWKDLRFQWWIDMLLEVNWEVEPKKVVIGNNVVLCGRGQCCLSVLSWQKRWGTTRQKVRGFFRLLEVDKMITIEGTSDTTIITICNYDDYNNSQPTKNQRDNQQKTSSQPQYNNTNNTTSKEVVYTLDQEKGFEAFETLITKFAPEVGKMKEPFTIDQYLKIKKKFPGDQGKILIKNLLVNMHNWKELNRKYVSAYRTFLNWANRET